MSQEQNVQLVERLSEWLQRAISTGGSIVSIRLSSSFCPET
jgi:hypothetical protein